MNPLGSLKSYGFLFIRKEDATDILVDPTTSILASIDYEDMIESTAISDDDISYFGYRDSDQYLLDRMWDALTLGSVTAEELIYYRHYLYGEWVMF